MVQLTGRLGPPDSNVNYGAVTLSVNATLQVPIHIFDDGQKHHTISRDLG